MQIFFQLLRRDMVIFRKEYLGKLFDMLIMFSVWVAVFGYIMPLMGLQASYGVFIMVGAIASFGVFEVIGQANTVITDINGDRTISYLLLLPISSLGVFCYIAVSWALQSLTVVLPLYLVGKMMFWTQFDLSQITWYRFVLALIVSNLFYGFFALWIAGALKGVRDLSRIYFRFISPLFFLGCYFFTWHVAYELSPILGYIVLFDPFSYVMEIMRAAILGQEGYLPFWGSFGALWTFIFACGWHSVRRLRRHLDCI